MCCAHGTQAELQHDQSRTLVILRTPFLRTADSNSLQYFKRILVLVLVEQGDADQVFDDPQTDYTRELMAAAFEVKVAG